MIVYKSGQIEIWAMPEPHGVDFYIYGVYASGFPRICPSLDMALDVAAIDPD